jgi:hypothetical protein
VLQSLLLVVHICAATLVFGPKLFWVRRLKTGLETKGDAARIAVEAIAREAKVVGISGMLLIATGIALVFDMGGFGAVGHQIHMGFGLALLAMVVGVGFEKPALLAIRRCVAEGNLPAAEPYLRKVIIGNGFTHTLWLATLVLMCWRGPFPI